MAVKQEMIAFELSAVVTKGEVRERLGHNWSQQA